MTGVVKWYNEGKGYGFIKPTIAGPDVFVHYTAIQGEGFKTLVEGETVTFDLIAKRGPQAVNVVRSTHGKD